ncbi:MAG: hypothetical protein ACETWQ_16280, partial [Phycisphaerae bacterium]
MCRKLICLAPFVLVLGLIWSTADAAEPFQEIGGLLVMEGEHFMTADGRNDENSYEWGISTEIEGFVGTGYVETPGPQGTNGAWENSCELTYEVQFNTSGTYSMWVRRRTLDGASNSCWVGLDGVQMGSNDNTEDHNVWIWKSLGTMEVRAGLHTFNLRRREAAFKVDRIVLTTDSSYTPTDDGPPESPQGPLLKAYSPGPADGELYMDTWASLYWSAGKTAETHDVYFGENFNDVNDGTGESFRGNQVGTYFTVGFPGFPYPDGLVPGTTYYWRIDEVEADGTTIYKGDVWSFRIPPKTPYDPDPADGAEFVGPDVVLSWTPGFGAMLHYVYFGENFDDVSNAAGALPQGTAAYTPGPLELGKTYYWRVDEFDGAGTYKGDVWGFTTPGAVGSLNPSNGAVNVKQTQILSWLPGDYAASHEVYFGTDKELVRNADTGSPEYKGTRDLGSESFDPGKLEWDSTYYWRIDEVNNANPDSPWVGLVWSFTTANFLIVDDFESYNDLDPDDPESNRIYNAWLDGYDDPTNGSLVGYDAPPFAEQTIVHSGSQSMPLFYDNSVGYSEATLTLTYPRDWTEKGVNTLTIWFRGISANAAETLYVALNGSAVVNHDNPNAAQITAWTAWNIDLPAPGGFADQGVNLANVNTIALGLGNKKNPQAGG